MLQFIKKQLNNSELEDTPHFTSFTMDKKWITMVLEQNKECWTGFWKEQENHSLRLMLNNMKLLLLNLESQLFTMEILLHLSKPKLWNH